MTIKERLDWLMSFKQCSDTLASADVRRMVANQASKIKEQYQEELDEKIRLIEDMKYIAGIVERGTGKPLRSNVAIKRQLLAYVKSLEAKMEGWLEYCKSCKRKHRVEMQKCHSCGVYEVPQPISDKVADKCRANYDCDGCIAYRDHLR